MKNLLYLLLSLLFITACGKEGTRSSNSLQGSNGLNSSSGESLYYQLPAPDMRLNSTSYTSVIREQRESGTHFCRRFQSAGTNVYSYICYQKVSSGSQALSTFNSLLGSYASYSVSFGNYIGSSFVDEITNGSMYGGGSVLCQKIMPQNPSAGVSYQCFQKI